MDKATPTPSPASYDSVMALVGAFADCYATGDMRATDLLARLREEVQHLAQQAARYQWLRNPKNAPEGVIDRFDRVAIGGDGVQERFYTYISGDELDAAIDAAMAKD